MRLFDCRTIESLGADLEFQDENNSVDYQDDIGPLAHSRDCKFKKDVAPFEMLQGLLHY